MKEVEEAVERLKQIKAEKGMSQEKMAREIGVSLQTVTRWLNGKWHPSIHVLDKVNLFIAKNS